MREKVGNKERKYFATVTLLVINNYRQQSERYQPHTLRHRTHRQWADQTPAHLQDCNQIHEWLQATAVMYLKGALMFLMGHPLCSCEGKVKWHINLCFMTSESGVNVRTMETVTIHFFRSRKHIVAAGKETWSYCQQQVNLAYSMKTGNGETASLTASDDNKTNEPL